MFVWANNRNFGFLGQKQMHCSATKLCRNQSDFIEYAKIWLKHPRKTCRPIYTEKLPGVAAHNSLFVVLCPGVAVHESRIT